MNQSYSFRMLNRWIEESESNVVPLKSKKDEEEENKQKEGDDAWTHRGPGWRIRHGEDERG